MDETKTAVLNPAERKPPPVGKRFQKGQSGNPGGRPANTAELRKKLLEMSPDVEAALRAYIRVPTEEEMENKSPLWFQSLAEKRIAAIKIWFEFCVPKPKEVDAFADAPLPKIEPGSFTTLSMLSEARDLIATEILRLKGVSASGVPLSESASARLTELVKQLSLLSDEEAKLRKTDPFAQYTDKELEERYKTIQEDEAANAN